ncbi:MULTISPECIES: bifunctional diguanylate cyclase/phosphodiesterase [Arcobacter]|uniref:Diguanylate cyclase/phosphodiesterase (LapD/MoxY domain) n=1 Tax=Arcobacter ellisii TaxID=913109 RepID=A0A347U6D9_9BACT|nr:MULTISPECIES: EAL domain-containing protein [Arcobacter]AXX94417.1 diguanylate cyclase/phosphodiesterase (LapD/MoxY domain) [Arcobacter ellisii]MBD3829108.1 EAL domain-containing protein [Arcobacter sp.]MDD3009008.1 EAL domain-containing protein [Arcobacter sp.]RXI31116.1 GGDEF domain-containing protein [Arcobacter ellisii]
MSLSKQLYIIISIIFFMIFTGNFIISVKNTKEYLEVESQTKAQDTATSLGMSLKNLLKDKTNPEIESVINAIANRGFYKEIRLEDALFTIKESDLIKASKDLDNTMWEISNLTVDEKLGKIEINTLSDDFEKELLSLENPTEEVVKKPTIKNPSEDIYNFIPNVKTNGKITLTFNFTATNQFDKKIDTSATITLDKILVQVTRDIKFDSVPEWFINSIPIELEEQVSEISNGWQTSAIIYVSANPGDAYDKLYSQAKSAIIYAIIAFIISIVILFIFVQYLLKPLKKLEKLAHSIASGKFGKIDNLPWTTEIKAVAIAFNDMSTKIENIINRLNSTLENLTKKLSLDELTGLSLKQSFETDMKHMFIHKSTGYIFVIKIFDLASFAKAHTNAEVNSFIKKFAKVLATTKLNDKSKVTAYRFFGSEFALIAQNFSYEDAVNFTKLLQKGFEELSLEFNKKDIVHIGATPFNPIGTTPEILQSANQAYEKATVIGPNEFFITDTNELVKDMESWRELIFDIIDNSKFDVNYIGDCKKLDESHDNIVMQEAFTSIKDKDNNNIPIGTFVSIAEKYEKIVDFDKKVIQKVMNHILINNIKHDISINLSLESINNTAFIAWLEKKLVENKNIASQLVFSATAYAVAKDVDKFKFFADEIHQCGAKIIIKRFETKFIPLNNIKDFNLDYIRLARDYTNEISNDYSKQSFVESISELTTLLNIKLLAENVQKDEDLAFIKKHNLYAASR